MDTMEDLVRFVKELGWGVALPTCDGDEDVPGMIIGTSEYVEAVTGCLPDGQFWKPANEEDQKGH